MTFNDIVFQMFRRVIWKLLRGFLGPLGGLPGASWRPLGGLLGASWGHLGASWAQDHLFDPFLTPQEAKIIEKQRFLMVFGGGVQF